MNPMLIQQLIKTGGALTGAAIPVIANAATPGAGAERRDYRALVKRFKKNDMGLSGAEQQQIQQRSIAPLQSAFAGTAAELARAGASSGSTVDPMQAALASQQQALAGASAAGAANAAALSQQVAGQRRAEYFARLAARKATTRQDASAFGKAIADSTGGGGGQGGSALGLDSITSMFGG